MLFRTLRALHSNRPLRARGGLGAGGQGGVTLVELLVVLAIMAIMLGIGLPGFQSLAAQNRATGAANELQSSLQFARSAAVTHSQPVTICVANFTTNPATCSASSGNSGNWHAGWIVLQNGVVLREQAPLNPSVTLTGRPRLVYTNTGTLAGQTLAAFELAVAARENATRRICMMISGSSRVVQGDASC